MNHAQQKIANKKAEILKSAMKVINERGYEQATMEEIAAELHMTKGSLYYYFKNKQDLIYQCHHLVLSEAVKELEEHLNRDEPIIEILRKMIFTHIHYTIEEKETYNIIVKPSETFDKNYLYSTLELRNYYDHLFDQVIIRGITLGQFSVKEPQMVRMYILGALNWMQQWYYPEGRLSKEELQQLFFEYTLTLLKGNQASELTEEKIKIEIK